MQGPTRTKDIAQCRPSRGSGSCLARILGTKLKTRPSIIKSDRTGGSIPRKCHGYIQNVCTDVDDHLVWYLVQMEDKVRSVTVYTSPIDRLVDEHAYTGRKLAVQFTKRKQLNVKKYELISIIP